MIQWAGIVASYVTIPHHWSHNMTYFGSNCFTTCNLAAVSIVVPEGLISHCMGLKPRALTSEVTVYTHVQRKPQPLY